jgi:hypothetical protein
MRKTHLLATLIAFILFPISVVATQPRLTIVVILDGMTSENLDRLRPFWSVGGLRTLSEEAFQTTITFPHAVNGGAETTATLMTGTTPSKHGVMSDEYFSRTFRKANYTLYDQLVSGIGTTLQLSPRAITATTLTDEWRIHQGTEALIYAIGLQPHSTILMAGHAANACCWLDASSLKWVTTSFYSEGLPAAADAMNISGRIDELAERTWTPRLDISIYTSPTKDERRRLFNYLPKRDLLHTTAANTLVVEMALALQQAQQLGTDNTPDLLLMQMTTLSPKASSDAILSAEQEDMYLYLNQDLGYLMEQLDKRIGKSNYQLLLLGRPMKGYDHTRVQQAGIPVQHFNVDRAAALVSTYLMAIYGHERWVDAGYGPFIYLNRTLIEQKRLSLETIQRQVANLLMDFEGVHVAYPIHEAITSDSRQSIYRKHAGDVYFQLQENWVLDASENTIYDKVLQSNPAAPLLFWSGTLRAFPDSELQATDIKKLIFNY